MSTRVVRIIWRRCFRSLRCISSRSRCFVARLRSVVLFIRSAVIIVSRLVIWRFIIRATVRGCVWSICRCRVAGWRVAWWAGCCTSWAVVIIFSTVISIRAFWIVIIL